MKLLANQNNIDAVADALYTSATNTVRDNGTVRAAELTAAEKRSFAKIARDNGSDADPVVAALVDAGVNASKARGFATEMRARENGGVTALTVARPNPSASRTVPPNLSEIRSRNMAKFVGPRDNRKKHRDNPKRKYRDNRSEDNYNKIRGQFVKGRLAPMGTRLAKSVIETDPTHPSGLGDLATLDQTAVQTIARNYMEGITSGQRKGPKSKTNITRNRFSQALIDGQVQALTNSGELTDIGMVLVPYAGPITSGGRGGSVRNVMAGPNAQRLLMAGVVNPKVATGIQQGGSNNKKAKQYFATMALAKAARDQGNDAIADALEALAGINPPKKTTPKVAKRPGKARLAALDLVKDALQNSKPVNAAAARKVLKALAKAKDGLSPEAEALVGLKGKDFADKLRENRRRRKNGLVRRARHNAGGFDAKTIGFGVAGFAAGTVVGTLATDYAKKLPVVGGYAPYLVAAGLAADAYFSHSNRGYIFKNVQNIGLRYGLAAGLIFPMVARGLASKLLQFTKLGMIDSFAGGAKAASGFGQMDIYDTAFEGTGEYLAESGLGEYLAESGLGAVEVQAAPAGLGYFVGANGLGAEVMAASAGFGEDAVSVRAAVGSDEDTAGELDAAYLDGMGEISVADMREFAGVGADDDDDSIETEGAEMSDDDLAIEGLGAVPGASVVRMTPDSASRAQMSRIAHVRVLGRSKRVPGTLIVAITKVGRARLPKVGGIPQKPSSIGIPPAPGGQANFRPGGIFSETIFGGRGFMG